MTGAGGCARAACAGGAGRGRGASGGRHGDRPPAPAAVDLILASYSPNDTTARLPLKIPFVLFLSFEVGTHLSAIPNIQFLDIDMSTSIQFRDHLESKIKLSFKNFSVFNRALQYLELGHHLLLYEAQVRPHLSVSSRYSLLQRTFFIFHEHVTDRAVARDPDFFPTKDSNPGRLFCFDAGLDLDYGSVPNT
ncbi:hypothetical protein EVAR_99078_1 [Eumeta japonica]|uniref:Uncharacterized protein n=1 Tax=Eumeta variegata TaxID=151549 RepID=A0A4C1ZM66_EUMVA|nr:hypothetical protein EVAR_99078_1 [Eumeta japonica]